MKLISVLITLLVCVTLSSVCAASPALADANSLPTIDPQARQILAAMVNSYSDIEEYADEETIVSVGDTSPIFPQQINCHFSVALRRGSSIFLTSKDAKGEEVTVHAIQESTDQFNQRFLVFTTDNRYPSIYLKDAVSEYQEALVHSCRLVGLGTVGASALFSEGDISSLLLEPAFDGLQLDAPLMVDEVMCDSVTVKIDKQGGTNTLTFSIGQKDHLLRRLKITHMEGAQTTTFTENFNHIRTKGWPPFPSLFPGSYFQYAPPDGYRLVSFFPPIASPVVKPSVTPEKTYDMGK